MNEERKLWLLIFNVISFDYWVYEVIGKKINILYINFFGFNEFEYKFIRIFNL